METKIREVRETPMPERIARLPRTASGYPIPFFVAYVDGVPDLKLLDGRKQLVCIQNRLCGICGESVEPGEIAFITGPKGVENRVCTDPGMHEGCAEYAVHVCPFMVRPNARRSPKHHPDSLPSMGAIDERPEKTAIYLTRHYVPRQTNSGAILIRLYAPIRLRWFVDGIEVSE